jgi:S-DNA-T family DNA segregation ATPase FtsK/SpoIIIE
MWLGVAGLVGAIARSIGHSAKDLDPEQRRDGVGFGILGLAVIVAASVWGDIPGAIGSTVRAATTGTVGVLAGAVPLLLIVIAWRTLRHPDLNGPPGRQVIGWISICGGILGLVHLSHDVPRYSDKDPEAMRAAGGAIGFLFSAIPVDLLKSSYVVAPLLVLLVAFGLLIVTSTPVYAVPARLREVRDKALGRNKEEAPEAEPKKRKHPRTAVATDEEPFENPLVDGPDEDRQVPARVFDEDDEDMEESSPRRDQPVRNRRQPSKFNDTEIYGLKPRKRRRRADIVEE